MDLIVYINENYYGKKGFKELNNENLDSDENLDTIETQFESSEDLSDFSDNYNSSADNSTIKPQKTSNILQRSASLITIVPSSFCESISSTNVGCFSFLTHKKQSIFVFNVKIESMSDLRSNSLCLKPGELKKEAIACDLEISFECKMQNYWIACKKISGRYKLKFIYDFIKYKSTKTEKNLEWNSLIEFSR